MSSGLGRRQVVQFESWAVHPRRSPEDQNNTALAWKIDSHGPRKQDGDDVHRRLSCLRSTGGFHERILYGTVPNRSWMDMEKKITLYMMIMTCNVKAELRIPSTCVPVASAVLFF
jgi:hypothetical protein